MLGKTDVVAHIAVRSLETARKFYEGTLGLKPIATEGEEAIVFQSGNTKVSVYRSQYAGTNQATTLTWAVGDDLESAVRDLKAKGIRFEHYDMPGVKHVEDVHVFNDLKAAWFKDPDGNILCIANR